jgi:hypothetical protein
MNPHLRGSDAVPVGPTAKHLQDPEERNLETSYILYELAAGTYEFAYFRHKVGYDRFSRATHESRFTIRPGEITYIGTYEFPPAPSTWYDPTPTRIQGEIET